MNNFRFYILSTYLTYLPLLIGHFSYPIVYHKIFIWLQRIMSIFRCMCVTACQNVMVSWASLLNGKTFVHVYRCNRQKRMKKYYLCWRWGQCVNLSFFKNYFAIFKVLLHLDEHFLFSVSIFRFQGGKTKRCPNIVITNYCNFYTGSSTSVSATVLRSTQSDGH
jgi:hypothetical protein